MQCFVEDAGSIMLYACMGWLVVGCVCMYECSEVVGYD